jgi:hypothetical protein
MNNTHVNYYRPYFKQMDNKLWYSKFEILQMKQSFTYIIEEISYANSCSVYEGYKLWKKEPF